MDLNDPALLFSGLIIGLIGMGISIYGRKQESHPALFAGLVITAFPWFLTSVLALWITFAASIAGLYILCRLV